jgi:hypothetical protein
MMVNRIESNQSKASEMLRHPPPALTDVANNNKASKQEN